METEPLERIDEHQSGETPEDVAILYSWANLQGAKYRDFSANRREYRAQMRHRAAEQLRLMELRAQSEAEAAASQAEAEAAAAHAEADAASVKLAVSRSISSPAPEEILKEKEVEELRRSSLREAAQQARRAAAERLEAARRAEAAALADSIARREEREIAEAQASALRQAAQYHDSELRSKQMMAQHPEDQVPGRISDPYSPQILAEGAYYDGPGTPPSELEASRFRSQREYIERSTGTELPPFKLPPLFDEDRKSHAAHPEIRPQHRGRAPEAAPRRLSEMNAADREYYTERHLHEERNTSVPPKQWPGRQKQEALHDALDRDRSASAPDDYRESREDSQSAEVVSRIPQNQAAGRSQRDFREPDYQARREEPLRRQGFDRSLLDEQNEIARHPRSEFAPEAFRSERTPDPIPDEQWHPRRDVPPAAIRTAHPGEDPQRLGNRQDQREQQPQLYSATPRPSGAWLRQISATDALPLRGTNNLPPSLYDKGVAPKSTRPSVEATYDSGQRSDALTQSDQQPSGFRPPWLSQAQAPRQSGPQRAKEASADAKPTPRWLNPEPVVVAETNAPASEPVAQPKQPKPQEHLKTDTLQGSQENVASRWFALKGVFARTDDPEATIRQLPREKNTTPMIAVYSLAGGVGKTSLVATLGRTLSQLGEKVMLADTTSHGLLPFYFGANELVSGVTRIFTPPSGSADAPVHMVSYELDQKASSIQSQTALMEELLVSSQQVNRVLLDLNGNCGWLIERLAKLKPTILVPVAADMNSIISLKAVEKRFAAMQSADGEPLRPVYLLNQFDASLPLHLDLREVLRQQLGDRLLPIVIRRAPGISEALAEGMTIVDYDPDSPASQDFLGLANWFRAVSAPAAVGFRNLRWSER